MSSPGEGNARIRVDHLRQTITLRFHTATVTMTMQQWVELEGTITELMSPR